jgi:hypothetical protein
MYLYTMCKPIKKQLPERLGASSEPLGPLRVSLLALQPLLREACPDSVRRPGAAASDSLVRVGGSLREDSKKECLLSTPWPRLGERQSVSRMAMLTCRVISAGAVRSPWSDSHGWRPVVSAAGNRRA